MMRDVEELVGNYYSKQFVKDKILRLTPEEQKRIEKEIKKEEKEAEADGDQYPPQAGMPPVVPPVNKINVQPGADPGGGTFTPADQGLATSQGMQQAQDEVQPELLAGQNLLTLNKKRIYGGK